MAELNRKRRAKRNEPKNQAYPYPRDYYCDYLGACHCRGEYSVIPVNEYPDALVDVDKDGNKACNISGLTKVIKKSDGSLAFDCVVKGYKSGFDIMVGVKDGAVFGVAIVSVGEETPGLGTNTDDPDWLANFKNKTGEVTIVKNKPNPADNEVNAVTSATFSSKGVAKAVNIALGAYNAFGGDFR